MRSEVKGQIAESKIRSDQVVTRGFGHREPARRRRGGLPARKIASALWASQ
jgi:hypothetical protein